MVEAADLDMENKTITFFECAETLPAEDDDAEASRLIRARGKLKRYAEQSPGTPRISYLSPSALILTAVVSSRDILRQYEGDYRL